MSGWTQSQIRSDFADLHGGVYENEIIEEREHAFDEWLKAVRKQAWEEGFYAASDGEFQPERGENPYEE